MHPRMRLCSTLLGTILIRSTPGLFAADRVPYAPSPQPCSLAHIHYHRTFVVLIYFALARPTALLPRS